MQKTCKWCGVEYTTKGENFCCRECYQKDRKTKTEQIKKVCKVCKKTFYVNPCIVRKNGGIYCSRECFESKEKISTKEVSCKTCGKQFVTFTDRIKKNKNGVSYCSKECYWIGRKEDALELFICGICGKIELVRSSDLRRGKTFCSRMCRGISQRKRIKYNCIQCGIEVRVKKSVKEKGSCFCSKECKHKWQDGRKRIDFGITKDFVEENYINGKMTTQEIADNVGCCLNTAVSRIQSFGFYVKESLKYRGKRWEEIRKEVYKRDNYTCQRCGKKRGAINAHHFISHKNEETRFLLSNLVTLCRSCHVWVHSRKNIDNEYLSVQFELFDEIA